MEYMCKRNVLDCRPSLMYVHLYNSSSDSLAHRLEIIDLDLNCHICLNIYVYAMYI